VTELDWNVYYPLSGVVVLLIKRKCEVYCHYYLNFSQNFPVGNWYLHSFTLQISQHRRVTVLLILFSSLSLRNDNLFISNPVPKQIRDGTNSTDMDPKCKPKPLNLSQNNFGVKNKCILFQVSPCYVKFSNISLKIVPNLHQSYIRESSWRSYRYISLNTVCPISRVTRCNDRTFA